MYGVYVPGTPLLLSLAILSSTAKKSLAVSFSTFPSYSDMLPSDTCGLHTTKRNQPSQPPLLSHGSKSLLQKCPQLLFACTLPSTTSYKGVNIAMLLSLTLQGSG